MSFRLTHYGADVLMTVSLVIYPLAVLSAVYFLPVLPILVLVWVGTLAFFRHPYRQVSGDETALLAPADGRVIAVEQVEGTGPFHGKVYRIDIFLSIFDVHVNRAPCSGSVESVRHRPGRFLNALKPEASVRNESNEVLLRTPAGVPVLVRQVAGAIARRIVCDCIPGDRLERGEPFGMIKFGSRTELYLPVDALVKVSVNTGQRVRAGSTVIGELR